VDPVTMFASLIVALAAAAIIALFRFGRGRLASRKPKAAPTEDFPVRLSCHDETEFDPGSGYHEGLHFEVFNHSGTPVKVKGFGLKFSMAGPGADWVEHEQARQHPRIEFPVWLDPYDELEGYIDHESLGDELRERGLFEYIRESTPYVQVVGFSEHTTEISVTTAD
jgi:hypothetical protein